MYSGQFARFKGAPTRLHRPYGAQAYAGFGPRSGWEGVGAGASKRTDSKIILLTSLAAGVSQRRLHLRAPTIPSAPTCPHPVQKMQIPVAGSAHHPADDRQLS